jgi:putative phosphoribosyl transferase
MPPRPRGFVLFASSRRMQRLDPRQVELSDALNQRDLGTLLFDLVGPTDRTGNESNLEILTEQLLDATEWSHRHLGAADLPLGYIGSGLGSAAALLAAAALGPRAGAVAVRGGRPDLAGEDLPKVEAATLLVFAGPDPDEAGAATAAAAKLHCPHRTRNLPSHFRPDMGWRATSPICRWMKWHLGTEWISLQQPHG